MIQLRKSLLTAATLVFLFVSVPISSDSAVVEHVLDNGLKVLILEDHKAPLATFQIWYRVGSRDEESGKTGLSHLLEHMMFKGTPRYGSKAFSKIIQRNGGIDNAMTSRDYTMYFQTMSSDRIGLSIELESDRMVNLILDGKETESERDVVKEERRMRYEDDPQNALFEKLVATALMNHPYRRPVIGWMSDVASINREDLYSHYKRFYSPDNAFIVIAGDVNPDDIIKRVKSSFGGVARSGIVRKQTSKEPGQQGGKRVYLKKEAELPAVGIAYHTPGFPHGDSYALEIMSSILSGGKSSRLYKSLVYDKKLALQAEADYSSMYIDPFLFFLWAGAAPGKDIAELEKSLYEEIERIRKEAPSDIEVQKAKNQIESFFIFGQDSLYMQAMNTGRFEMLGSHKLMDKYLEGIRLVTPQDVRRVAEKYFTEENRTAGILVPHTFNNEVQQTGGMTPPA